MAHPHPQSLVSADDALPDTPALSLHTEAMQIEYLQYPPGEGHYHARDEHTVFVNLAQRPIYYLHTQDGKTHTGLHRPGEMLITPANTPLFARWEGTEQCLQIRLSDRFLRTVAQETLMANSDRLTLLPQFQCHQAPIQAIATLLLTELEQQQPGGALYADSLANALAVQLLRSHGSTRSHLPTYDGGLLPQHLNQVLDYINAYLDQDIKLAKLAQLLGMSPFHFSRLFKQSVGKSPHQYLIQQRVERAKQLLKCSDQAIVDIALECGFNSHSHLSKQFRQQTGMTPKAYRTH